jgi:hypothetical protein
MTVLNTTTKNYLCKDSHVKGRKEAGVALRDKHGIKGKIIHIGDHFACDLIRIKTTDESLIKVWLIPDDGDEDFPTVFHQAIKAHLCEMHDKEELDVKEAQESKYITFCRNGDSCKGPKSGPAIIKGSRLKHGICSYCQKIIQER